jgi:hypothetical protein
MSQSRNGPFLVVLAISLANGLTSPFLVVAYWLMPTMVAPLFFGLAELVVLPEFMFYLSSLAVSTATLLVGGVPAALYERLVPGALGSRAAMYVWVAGAALLSLPALGNLFGA